MEQSEFFAQFPRVPIGTSNPVTLLDGLQLLPGITPARAGIQVNDSFTRILYQAGTFLFARTKVAADYKLLLGVAGPSIAFLFDPVTVTARNQADQGKVDLDFSGSDTITAQSGFVAGVGFTTNLHIVQELYLPERWFSPWKFKWQTVFEKQLTINIDLLQLLVFLIRYLFTRNRENPNGSQRGSMENDAANPLKKFLNGQTVWRLFDEVNGRFTNPTFPSSRTLTPAPRMTIPWNMVDYVPLLAQFAKGLQALKGDLFLGPTLSLQFPTTLRLEGLTVEGGQGSGSTADYDDLAYTSATVTGSGLPFVSSATPGRLTTRVKYETRVGVLLSCVFQVSIAKIFSFGVNTPSLDLVRLLRLPLPSLGAIENSVSSTLPTPPIVLVPQLTLSVTDSNGDPWPIIAGKFSKVSIVLRSPWPGPNPLTVNLTNDQSLPGFPSQLLVPVGEDNVSAPYLFPPREVSTGNPDQADETESAKPTAFEYTLRILAQASRQQVGDRLPEFESVQAVRVENPILDIASRIDAPFQQAKGPVWNPLNGIYMNPGNRFRPDVVPPGFNYALFKVTWNGARPSRPVPVQFTLLDEERDPWTASSVSVTVPGAVSGPLLRPTSTIMVPANIFENWEFRIVWDGIGSNNGYSNRFILTVDAGADYGQDEVWLYLANYQ